MEYISDLGFLFLFFNSLLFTISYKVNSKELKYFIIYLFICFVVQILSTILHDLREYNLFLSHYFFIGQFIFLSLFFSKITVNRTTKKIILFLIPLIAVPLIVNLIRFPKKIGEWSEIEIVFTSFPLLVYSFLFFVRKIDGGKGKKYIYFISGFFVYTLTSTLIFTLGNIGSRDLKIMVWKLNSILYLIFQILVFIEWFVNFRKLNNQKN
jgi:hypothetical protein